MYGLYLISRYSAGRVKRDVYNMIMDHGQICRSMLIRIVIAGAIACVIKRTSTELPPLACSCRGRSRAGESQIGGYQVDIITSKTSSSPS